MSSNRESYNIRVLGQELYNKVANSKILLVGAGGIGCELLKDLVMSGFKDIVVVTLNLLSSDRTNAEPAHLLLDWFGYHWHFQLEPTISVSASTCQEGKGTCMSPRFTFTKKELLADEPFCIGCQGIRPQIQLCRQDWVSSKQHQGESIQRSVVQAVYNGPQRVGQFG